ncbi:MAG TPA: exonuclease domain-containing protein [Kiritimatiellia bacterium]|nr:exonuclease domain-containing protein [Kiritimatiellia bacterium]
MIERFYRTTAYVWFDTEYSTLDLESAVLLQVAAVVTDADLQRIFPPEEDVRFHVRIPEGTKLSPWIEENMPDLLRVCRSELAMDVADVDARLAALVSRVNVPGGEDKRRPVLAGNSIHSDWRLAMKYLPRFMRTLHYRHLDVTALKLQWQDWRQGPEFNKDDQELLRSHLPGPKHLLDGKRHDAYYDVLASIAELNYYRHQFLAR